jgi:hypothetical protein
MKALIECLFFIGLVWLLSLAWKSCNGCGSGDYRVRAQEAQLKKFQNEFVKQVRAAQSVGGQVAPNYQPRSWGSAEEVLTAVSVTYQVPAGAIYGIWMKESTGLRKGWAGNWTLASEQGKPGSYCYRKYGAEKCQKLWLATVAICSQRRGDGTGICNPYEVKGSYALALGPMQHLPTTLLSCYGGRDCRWAGHAVDFDGDGAFDPHALPDAMAATAKLIRGYYDRTGSWIKAVNMYYGYNVRGYYEGHGWKAGVQDHWRKFCSIPGNCDASQTKGAYNFN